MAAGSPDHKPKVLLSSQSQRPRSVKDGGSSVNGSEVEILDIDGEGTLYQVILSATGSNVNIRESHVDIYIDGEATPSVQIYISEICDILWIGATPRDINPPHAGLLLWDTTNDEYSIFWAIPTNFGTHIKITAANDSANTGSLNVYALYSVVP